MLARNILVKKVKVQNWQIHVNVLAYRSLKECFGLNFWDWLTRAVIRAQNNKQKASVTKYLGV